MSTENGNQPAYPTPYKNQDGSIDNIGGLTKREYFAAMAMQGLLMSGRHNIEFGMRYGKINTMVWSGGETLADAALHAADELLAKLSPPSIGITDLNIG